MGDFFEVLSTNADWRGRRFVSTMAAKRFPFHATQWHPERPQFDWEADEHVNHSAHAAVANAWEATYLVAAARRCPQRARSPLIRQFATSTLEVEPGSSASPDPLDGVPTVIFHGFQRAELVA